jgi:hypothetical protein
MLGRNIGHFLSCKPNEIRQSKNKLKINLKKFAQSKYGCIFVPAIKLNTKTKIMENLKQLLKQGQTIIFDNTEFCETNQSDDFRSAECGFRNENTNTWANGFEIRFNGAFFSFKTFNAFDKKLNQLKEDFNLKFNIFETELQKL